MIQFTLDQVESAIRSTSSNWAMEISIVPPISIVHPNINSGASSQRVADTICHADKFKLIHVVCCVALCTSRARVDSSVYLHLQPHTSAAARYISTKPDLNFFKTSCLDWFTVVFFLITPIYLFSYKAIILRR